jgi:mutual gliding-motility protein MglA
MGALATPDFDAKVFSFITLDLGREEDTACTRRLAALLRGAINAQDNKVFTRRQRAPLRFRLPIARNLPPVGAWITETRKTTPPLALSTLHLTFAGALASGAALCYKQKGINTEESVPFINFPAREINCKLVYYGPGLGGKTANLQWIYDHTGANQKGKMVSLATETDRTLFFDFLPLDLGTVRGFKTRFHLYTVPGQVFYEASRRLILKGADGVVFVADSQVERIDANLETLDNLREHLKDHNLNFDTIPYVLQLNKRDLPNIMTPDELKKQLMVKGEPVTEGVAITGQGVFDTLKEVAKLVLADLKKNS